ncbi:MAG: DUF1707 and DUF4870 domain-containing protein [Actinomycetes bacterium]|jgi:uncharacterized protein|nr:MAG: hypothetical protein DIU60_25540 [Actinomycetota bacterium]
MQAAAPRGPGVRVVPHPQLRVTDQDREQVVERIKTAFAEGRIDKDEMDLRLDRAMTARTHGELAPVAQDLYPQGYSRPTPAYAPPRAGEPDGLERVGAAVSHLLMLAGAVVVGPLVMLIVGRNSPYVRRHAVEALNFHLTLLGATILLPFTVIGIPFIPVIWVVALILSIIGGLAALGEGEFRYPLTLRPVK